MIQRELTDTLKRSFSSYPVLTLTGPRQSGKTTLVKALYPEKAYFNLEDLETRRFAEEDPRGFLSQFPDGAILDEFQNVPHLASYIQVIVDESKQKERFILTGSQNLKLTNTVRQSLAGRTAVLSLLPLSLSELKNAGIEKSSFDEAIFFGGFPRVFDQNIPPNRAIADYAATYIERDVRELSTIESLPEFRKLLQLLSGRVGQLINYQNLTNELGVSSPTIKKWIGLLEATYLVFSLNPYYKNISKRLVKSSKLYFYDVAVAAYFLGIEESRQLSRHPLRGSLFENLVVLEALKQRFNQGRNNNLLFYQDSTGSEIDLVLEEGLKLLAVEIKSSSTLNRSYTKGFHSFQKVLRKGKDERELKKIIVYQGDLKNYIEDVLVENPYGVKKLLGKVGS